MHTCMTDSASNPLQSSHSRSTRGCLYVFMEGSHDELLWQTDLTDPSYCGWVETWPSRSLRQSLRLSQVTMKWKSYSGWRHSNKYTGNGFIDICWTGLERKRRKAVCPPSSLTLLHISLLPLSTCPSCWTRWLCSTTLANPGSLTRELSKHQRSRRKR